MREALVSTKATVKLRKGRLEGQWYLVVELYPIREYGSDKVGRKIMGVNRTITTPIWDKSSITKILPDGTFNYKPKRDFNGIIQCQSRLDQDSCIYADNIRRKLQKEYDNAALLTDEENEIIAQRERGKQDFIRYFNDIIYKRHPNSSKSIIVNWVRVAELLEIYSKGKPIPFKSISMKLVEDIKMFMFKAPMGGGKGGTISQNTASTYFSIFKAGLKQAFIDEYLTVDISAKIKGISGIEKPRIALTMDEVKKLVDTPCENMVLKRAFLFSVLTGLRHCDIKSLKWKQIQQNSKGNWYALVVQQKTKVPEYVPLTEQALMLCGERTDNDEQLIFEGLTDASWISRPLKLWMDDAGIKKHITFHCARHTFATLLLENNVDIYRIKSLMGHTNVKTTQIYTHVFNEEKVEAANSLYIPNLK